MDILKAKHKIGDPIHTKLFYADDRASMTFYGTVTASRIEKHSLFADRVHYDIYLEQADAPAIKIENLPEGFVLAGAPPAEYEASEGAEDGLFQNLDEILKP